MLQGPPVLASQIKQHLAARARVLRTGDLSGPLARCHDVVIDDTRHNFQGQHGPKGEIWPPRKDPRLKHPLLRLTLALYTAATGGAGHIFHASARQLVTGVATHGGAPSLRGARAHNFGYPPRNLPERKFLGLTYAGTLRCGRIILNGMDELLAKV